MKFPKVGDLRIKCIIDWEGDYVAAVQVYKGFWGGWSNQRSFYANASRTPAECVRMARRYVSDSETLQLGVLS